MRTRAERASDEPGRRGFTLLEVVVALLVLELAVTAAAGSLLIASSTLSRAEQLARAAARVEGVVDSLASSDEPTDGGMRDATGDLRWQLDDTGILSVSAIGLRGDTLFEIHTVLPPEVAR